MTRREILKYTAIATGYAVSGSVLSALLAGCKAEPTVVPYKPVFFSAEEYALLEALSETTLPATDTPGAKEVGVAGFIDQTIGVIYKPSSQALFRKRLAALAADCQSKAGKAFGELSPEEQLKYLNGVDLAAKAEAEALETLPPTTDEDEAEARWPFWLGCKELIFVGYFSSQKIGTEVLAYDPVPGMYNGCMPLAEATGGKVWAL